MQEGCDRGELAPAPRTLIDILRDTAARHPDASAIEGADGAISYAELIARVNVTAARLCEQGVQRGDRVGVRMPSGERALYLSILSILSILAAGAAYVPVDADDPQERADLVFGEANVRGVIGAGGVFHPADDARGTAPGLFSDADPHPGTNAHSTVQTRDLLMLGEEISGIPLAGLFEAWTSSTDLPSLPASAGRSDAAAPLTEPILGLDRTARRSRR
ncbi:AMP-binding protein [Microbacterium tenebrionis]|uniref:AMP-binding protein n=1 Tax=Microbacterium tenebrionis TaxID=2830665 RepID=UPI003557AA1E